MLVKNNFLWVWSVLTCDCGLCRQNQYMGFGLSGNPSMGVAGGCGLGLDVYQGALPM